MSLSLVLALSLACSPNLAESIRDKDFTGHGFTLSRRSTQEHHKRVFTLELHDSAGALRWKAVDPDGLDSRPEFSPDGWVAFDLGLFEVALYSPSGVKKLVSVRKLLTPAEERRVPRTSCGLTWYRGARFEDGALVIAVTQRDAEPLTFKVTLSSLAVSR